MFLVLAVLAIAGTLTAIPFGSNAASAQPPDVKPKSEKWLTSWGAHDGNTPDCGSINISGNNSIHTQWKITSSIGSGSKVLPGTEWDITAVLDGHTFSSFYNDGPDPLTLQMVPSGPIERVSFHPSVRASDLDNENAYWGDSWVGPLNAIGDWGYAFDSNSGPKLDGLVQEYSDGVDVTLRLHVRATSAGQIQLHQLEVGGWDSTPIAASVHCAVNLDWNWTVLAPDMPVVHGESVKTDATYPGATDDDANGGGHGITIDVLKNDDDANTPGGIGDHDDVRLASWSVSSEHGGSVDCGQPFDPPKDEATFTNMSVGPCRYDPPESFSGVDTFHYTVRQGTDLAERDGTVSITVKKNRAPAAAPSVIAAQQNTDGDYSVEEQVSDPDGDPTTCMNQLVAPPAPAVGVVTMHQDCSFHWNNTDPMATGNVTFTYRVCDTHALLADNAMGTNATKTGNYHSGVPSDLSASTSRRCTEAEATIAVLAGLVIAPHVVKDTDTVDAGYSGDAVGPYRVQIPVFANDFDPNGPKPMDVSIATAPDPSEGTATVVGTTHIEFTPADGFSGPVSFTYRNCEDPSKQNPAYEGNGICGIGTVQIDVRPNAAPIVLDDAAELAPGDQLVDFDVSSNDVEPDGESLACDTTPVSVSDPAKVTSLALSSTCLLDLEPADGATGTVAVTYRVCDDHHLTSPKFPSLPYGADGRFPNSLAPRCTTAIAQVELLAPPADPGEQPDGGVDQGPTDPDPGPDGQGDDQGGDHGQDPGDPGEPGDPGHDGNGNGEQPGGHGTDDGSGSGNSATVPSDADAVVGADTIGHPNGAVAVAPTGSTSTTGSLPVTGAMTLPFIGIALALVAGGLLIVLEARVHRAPLAMKETDED